MKLVVQRLTSETTLGIAKKRPRKYCYGIWGGCCLRLNLKPLKTYTSFKDYMGIVSIRGEQNSLFRKYNKALLVLHSKIPVRNTSVCVKFINLLWWNWHSKWVSYLVVFICFCFFFFKYLPKEFPKLRLCYFLNLQTDLLLSRQQEEIPNKKTHWDFRIAFICGWNWL